MGDFQIKCDSESRKKLFQAIANGPNDNNQNVINGIDFIEVKRVVNHDNQSSNDSNINSGSDISISEKANILLLLFLFREIQSNTIDKENVIIIGGARIQNIEIDLAGTPDEILNSLNDSEKEVINSVESSQRKKLIIIRPRQEGDFSIYTLKLIEKGNPEKILNNFDPIFCQIDFSFKVDCIQDFDCKLDSLCPPATFDEPLLDYMAKDYASFTRLILSRFGQIMPDWKEKSAADLTNVLVELLSYVGDHLSYYQDSVSTEAYLETARERISVRRHARLLDYFIGEGSNARTWICLTVDPAENIDGLTLKKSTKLLTGDPKEDVNSSKVLETDLKEIVSQNDIQIFETLHDKVLYSSQNEILFYTWGETNCCLPKGATHATLLSQRKINGIVQNSLDFKVFTWEDIVNSELDQKSLMTFIKRISPDFRYTVSINIIKLNDNKIQVVDSENASRLISVELLNDMEKALAFDSSGNFLYEFTINKLDNQTQISGLSLSVGDVLIFEEVISPTTLTAQDRDPSHRQAIKLRQVKRNIDPMDNTMLVEIFWDKHDALKFPLCINVVTDDMTGNVSPDPNGLAKIISVARGNVVLVDNGYTIENEELEAVPKYGLYYPKLAKSPTTFASPFISNLSAYASIYCAEQYGVAPAIELKEGTSSEVLNSNLESEIDRWYPKTDLLSSDKFAKEFVVEIDNNGTSCLRFGDGKNGQKPEGRLEGDDPVKFFATYRVGNGKMGNVGSETIRRIVKNAANQDIVQGILNIRNPMPAVGGTEPESLNEVRQNAPVAFMIQERAVTEDDYNEVLRRHPEVQRSMALFRWTGSWYTVYVTIDRIEGKIVDSAFKQEIYSYLNRFRLAGYDLEINSPNFVPLDIVINVCVKPNHYTEKIKKTLLNLFSTLVLEGGQIGFFHPDNFTFGQPLYLSKVYQNVMNVEGVKSLLVRKFQPMGKAANRELEDGIIQVQSSEIIRLDNDPNFPDNGKIEFIMEGGI